MSEVAFDISENNNGRRLSYCNRVVCGATPQ